MTPSLPYRPEIDGLRAIAVAAVVLYHAGLGGSGFVGVDLFFVISGYLITALLLREERIDLLAFYARRVRRIMPAAVLVVLATLAAASLLLPPAELVRAANSAGAAAVFAANVFFQLTTGGYWDASAEQMPLLHLWSLSVEEQFYLAWPALLMLVPRNRLLPVLVALSLASLASAEWLMATNPTAAFYQTPARFWELAAGGIIAALPVRAFPKWTAWLGISVTAAACVWTPTHFPGLGALPAVAGAALVIAAVHGGGQNALLASKPFVGLGLISYSLYLWHWPLLAFYRATVIGEGSQLVRLELCAVAVLLAVASYRYVEQPFRRMRFPASRTVAVGASISLLLLVGASAWGVRLAQIEAARPQDDPLALAAEADLPAGWRKCHYQVGDEGPLRTGCGEPAKVVIWGDSMAMAWQPLLESWGGGIDYSRDACGPFVGWMPADPMPADRKCRDWNALVAKEAAKADVVILVARWVGYPPEAMAMLEETLKGLPGRVIVIGPTPELRDTVPRCIRSKNLDACAVPRPEFEAGAAPIRKALQAYPVEFLDPSDWLCTATACPAMRDGIPLYFDSHHPSTRAVRAYAKKRKPASLRASGHAR